MPIIRSISSILAQNILPAIVRYLSQLRTEFKKYRLLINYYSRGVSKSLFSMYTISMMLFAISMMIFFVVIFPATLQHQFPILGNDRPIVLELNGEIFIKSNVSSPYQLIPVSGADVEVGGFKTITDSEGNFDITFLSKSHSRIPLVITYLNRSIIKHITFESNEFKREESMILDAGYL